MRSAETVLGIIRLWRTLESRVLQKAHARFGEGRMESAHVATRQPPTPLPDRHYRQQG